MTAFLDSLPDKLSFKLSKLVRTTRDSRYAKRSPSVSPDSSIKRRPTLAIGLHKTHETHRPGRKYSENLRYITSSMNYVGKCECAKRTKGTVEQKQEHKVRFSFNQTPSLQQSQSKSTANWNRKRASSEASRGTRTSVLAEECSRRSSSTSDTSVGSYESYNRGLLLLQLQRPSR
ncbi:uncharacterized protein LOC108667266 [Hyalella azteca]|uniref:Uncharacterized protein LOC108667266 n=1 Tax=Hyalella azteca TaxID=294128 RepID=A0A8B7N7E1_HYAAZ|nr:uncharacterized protein LOC108667266 [Hyalella azteca]